MTREEKLVYYATAPRVYAGNISQLIDGDFKKFWVGKLRGKIVSLSGGEYKFNTKKEAIECARKFKQSCLDDAKKEGLI